MGKTFYIIFQIRTNIGTQAKTAEARSKRRGFISRSVLNVREAQ